MVRGVISLESARPSAPHVRKHRCPLQGICILTCALIATEVIAGPLPIDAAVREVAIGSADRPELSPDGTVLTYSTIEHPPATSVTKQYGGRQTGILPNGMLSDLVGARLHVATLSTGAAKDISTGGSSWNAAFSPDGNRIAFLSDALGAPQVWIADAATGKARRISDAVVFVKPGNDFDRPVWSKDGTSIYVLVVHETISSEWTSAKSEEVRAEPTIVVRTSGVENRAESSAPPRERDGFGSQVLRAAVEEIDIKSGRRRVLVSGVGKEQPYAFQLSPSQRWVAYVTASSSDASCYELFVAPTTAHGAPQSLGRVAKIVYNDQSYTHFYSSVFHWSPTQDLLTFVAQEKLRVAELSVNGLIQIRSLNNALGRLSLPSVPGGNGWQDQVAVTSDGKLGVARLAESGALAFAVLPLDGSAAHRVAITRPLKFVCLIYRDASTLWQPDPGYFVLIGSDPITNRQVALRVSLVDGASNELYETESTFSPLTGVQGRAVLGVYTDATTPPDIYQFDAEIKHRRQLTHVQPELDRLLPPKRVLITTEVPSYDGAMRSLKTAVLLPGNFNGDERAAALISIYPNTEGSQLINEFGGGRLANHELAQFWLTRGYVVVLPDLGPLLPFNDVHANPTREMRDYLLPQLQHAAYLGYVDIDRLVLTGFSAGGYATLAILTDTSLFRAAVAQSSVTPVFITPWASMSQYLANLPFQRVDMIRTPVLMLHGTADMYTAHASEELFLGLQQLGRTAQLALYEGEGHYGWSKRDSEDALRRTLDFVTRYAPADQPSNRAHSENTNRDANAKARD
jgi:dipeptidyl aminopeptidase/acylaminoacyl peptidase